jgi:ATP-binding cassette, subfamily B, bacterial CvaB/MchF/RaxB
MVFQTEAAECGLACLAMVANYYGMMASLPELRRHFAVSLRGTNLSHLLGFASELGLASRALRLELEDLPYLQTPCVLHWDMNHFVVLKKATSKYLWLHDPAVGTRKLSMARASHHFTGVAMELTRTAAFTRRDESDPLRWRDLLGPVTALTRSLRQIFLLAVALELLFVLSPLFLQLTVDRVVAHHHPGLLTTLGIGFALLVVLQALLGGLRSWSTLYFGVSLKLQWYGRIFSHLVRLPVTFFEKRYFGDVMSRFEGADAIQRTLTNNFIEAILDGIISVFVLAVMLWYSVKLALIVIASAVLYLVLRHIAYTPMRGLTEEQMIRVAAQQSYFIETLRGIRTIKVFGREHSRSARWMNLLISSTNAQVAAEKMSIGFKSANTLLFGLQSVVVVWLGAASVLGEKLTLGMLFAFVAYQEQFKARISTLVDRAFEFRMLSVQAERLADLVQEKAETALSGWPAAAADEGSIETQALFFRYSNSEPWLLQNINLRIEPGECVAVTGRSGAGKSTLLKLMAGLLHPQSGEVFINGRSATANRAGMGKVGFVLQDDSLFSGTIAENIAFAADVADMSRVEECVRLACLHDEIMAMPMAYETMIGDMGNALSGGQQQRLLLARALYLKPSILILDEATSHLDIATEQRIAAMLAELRITRIFAAHRPNTVAIATRVISLDHAAVPVTAIAQPRHGLIHGSANKNKEAAIMQ